MDEAFHVHQYSIQQLIQLLADCSKASSEEIAEKLHIAYFEQYFAEIGANTIVVENSYVDRDFLEDYAQYYVRCFHDYPRKCARLHFFSRVFSEDDLTNFLRGQDSTVDTEILSESYLGFVVIKPLPQTIIGRTCLQTYEKEGRRYFPITRCYESNLFGIRLNVKHTLAYQEQDTVVAACATSALWSAFQGTGMLFQHSIPSPSRITEAATEQITDENRTRAFPSKGLDIIEMARAIKSVDLEPLAVRVSNDFVLKSTVYAYMRVGIPLILGIHLVDTAKQPNAHMGKHAVAVTGYSLPDGAPPVPYGPSGFRLRANKIERLYVHDDQVGPFARMVFDGQLVNLGNGNINSLSTSWKGSDSQIGTGRAVPDVLLAPLYHKIRIPFGIVQDQILELDALLKSVCPTAQGNQPNNCPAVHELEWDIYLTIGNNLKSEIANTTNLDPAVREEALLMSMPRFLWRATAYSDSDLMLDLIFDATDIEQGPYFILAIQHSIELAAYLRGVLSDPAIDGQCGSSLAWPIIKRLRQ